MGHDGVAEASQSLYPVGSPIIASTNCGLRTIPVPDAFWSRRETVLVPLLMASVSDVPMCAFEPARLRLSELLASPAVGVGQLRITASLSGRELPYSCLASPLLQSRAMGVGQDEDSLSLVGRSNVGRSKAIPLRIEPRLGQVPEYAIQPSSSERWDVLHEDEPGS